MGAVARRLSAVLAALAVACSARAATVLVRTDQGDVALELDPARAPRSVARFLAAPYAGSLVCEVRAHAFLVLGCRPDPSGAPRLVAVPSDAAPDEIDGAAMGLGDRILTRDERDWVWQQEIVPRYRRLEQDGRPVPPGLRALFAAAEAQGTAATSRLEGTSRLAYLQALGYAFTPGGSPEPVRRGAVATASIWPGESDARVLIALADLPARDGRATVFGRVAGGWDALERIAALPVDKTHRARTDVRILSVETP